MLSGRATHAARGEDRGARRGTRSSAGSSPAFSTSPGRCGGRRWCHRVVTLGTTLAELLADDERLTDFDAPTSAAPRRHSGTAAWAADDPPPPRRPAGSTASRACASPTPRADTVPRANTNMPTIMIAGPSPRLPRQTAGPPSPPTSSGLRDRTIASGPNSRSTPPSARRCPSGSSRATRPIATWRLDSGRRRPHPRRLWERPRGGPARSGHPAGVGARFSSASWYHRGRRRTAPFTAG